MTNRTWRLIPAATPRPLVYGDPVLPPRIWAKLELLPNGCWEWTGAGRRYGVVTVSNTAQLVHRVVYIAFRGPIPPGLQLDHYMWPDGGCIGTRCALHTRLASARENVLRSAAPTATNLAKERCSQGHPLSGASLYVDANGGRHCRDCMRVSSREYHRRRAARKRHGSTS